ncbi:MAG: hypothetical protein ABIW82_02355 [Dokdonella sp.]
MMLVSTLVPALLVVGAMYFVLIKIIPWAMLSYLLMAAVGVLCLLAGSVHMTYVGIEVAVIGMLLVWCHYRWWRRPRAGKAPGNNAV